MLMERVIVYAMGEIFKRYNLKLDWQEIIAIADKKEYDLLDFHGVPIIKPHQIIEYSFDYIAIFSNKLFEEIKNQLMGYYFIPEEKIISWRALIPYETQEEYETIAFYKEIIKEFQFHKILDIGMLYFPKYFFDSKKIDSIYPTSMDGIGQCIHLIGQNLYKHVYQNINESDETYELVIVWDKFEDIKNKIKELKGRTRYVLFHTLFSSVRRKQIKEIDKILKSYVISKRLCTSNGIFWLVDLAPKFVSMDIAVFVVTHKPYQVLCNNLYYPICVGEYYNKEFYTEKKGDNISHLNEKINECTALYWIWKNTNTEYIGLNHYRRYFYNNRICNSGNYLDKETAYKLMQKYDIILADSVLDYKRTVLNVILDTVNYELCIKALTIIRKAIKKNQPNYIDAFECVINGYSFHPCNMFIMRRKILDEYCKWLFSFLLEAAEEIDVDGYGDYDKRIMGFMAERLLTTWLLKQNLKIKELPNVIISV